MNLGKIADEEAGVPQKRQVARRLALLSLVQGGSKDGVAARGHEHARMGQEERALGQIAGGVLPAPRKTEDRQHRVFQCE